MRSAYLLLGLTVLVAATNQAVEPLPTVPMPSTPTVLGAPPMAAEPMMHSTPASIESPSKMPSTPKAEESPSKMPSTPKAEEGPSKMPSTPKAEEGPSKMPSTPMAEESPSKMPSTPKAGESNSTMPSAPTAEESPKRGSMGGAGGNGNMDGKNGNDSKDGGNKKDNKGSETPKDEKKPPEGPGSPGGNKGGGEWVTATITKTREHTITKCAPEVTNCPAAAKPVVEVTVDVYTTFCPVSELPNFTTHITNTMFITISHPGGAKATPAPAPMLVPVRPAPAAETLAPERTTKKTTATAERTKTVRKTITAKETRTTTPPRTTTPRVVGNATRPAATGNVTRTTGRPATFTGAAAVMQRFVTLGTLVGGVIGFAFL